MKTLKVSDETLAKLKALARRRGLSLSELLDRLVEERLPSAERPPEDFDPMGFGLWRDREEMADAPGWVRALRRSAWRRPHS